MKSFQSLTWHKDRMLLNDLVFRLEHFKNKDWELGDECFIFFKTKKLIDQYEHFFKKNLNTSFNNVYELGTFDGGSTAFWFEMLTPHKYVSIDKQNKSDSDYFKNYKVAHKIGERIRTYWRTNQRDKLRLQEIYDENFTEPLDLVIDDASHLYGPTKASFEALFPLVRPGGLYIIEDWAWGHWEEFFDPKHEWVHQPILTNLIFELVESVGSDQTFGNIAVYEGFAVIEKGTKSSTDRKQFILDSQIRRRPELSKSKNKFRKFLKRIKRAIGRRLLTQFF